MNAPAKDQDTACAIAAQHGILATPSRNDKGQRTVILRTAGGLWVKEVEPANLAEALREARCAQEVACTT